MVDSNLLGRDKGKASWSVSWTSVMAIALLLLRSFCVESLLYSDPSFFRATCDTEHCTEFLTRYSRSRLQTI